MVEAGAKPRGGRREFGIVLVGRILLAVLSLAYLWIVVRLLDGEGFGLYTFVFSTASFLSMFVYAASNVPSTRVSAANLDDTTLGPAVVSLALWSILPGAGLAGLIAGIVFAVSPQLDGPTVWGMAAGAGLIAASTGTLQLFATFVLGRRERIAHMSYSCGLIAARIAVIGLAVVSIGVASASGIIWLVALSGILSISVGAVVLARPARWPGFAAMRAKLTDLGFFRQYRQNWLVAVGSNLFMHGDKVALAFVLPIEVLGLLALYQQFARQLANLSIGSIYQFVSPFFLKKDGDRQASGFFKASAIAIGAFMGLVAVAALALPLVNAYYLDGTHTLLVGPFLLLCVGVALQQSSRINELRYFSTDAVARLIWPVLLAVGVFLTIGLYLASEYGISGAIVALVLAGACRYLAALMLMRKGQGASG